MQYWRGKAWTNIRPGTFSVWNWNKGQYDYYKAPPNAIPGYGDEVKSPPPQVLSGLVGEDPDTSSRLLPKRSKLVGSGQVALGEIVSLSGSNGLSPSWTSVALVVLGPIAILWLLAKLSEIQEEKVLKELE